MVVSRGSRCSANGGSQEHGALRRWWWLVVRHVEEVARVTMHGGDKSSWGTGILAVPVLYAEFKTYRLKVPLVIQSQGIQPSVFKVKQYRDLSSLCGLPAAFLSPCLQLPPSCRKLSTTVSVLPNLSHAASSLHLFVLFILSVFGPSLFYLHGSE